MEHHKVLDITLPSNRRALEMALGYRDLMLGRGRPVHLVDPARDGHAGCTVVPLAPRILGRERARIAEDGRRRRQRALLREIRRMSDRG